MNSVLGWAVKAVELLFVIGCVGSALVILLAGVEDVETVLGREDEPTTAEAGGEEGQ